MSDSTDSTFDPAQLRGLFGQDQGARTWWQPEELGDILEHQLSAPLEMDFDALDADTATRLRKFGQSRGSPASYRDLLHHPYPPVELLRLVKDFAKLHRMDPKSPIPKSVANVLYFGSIAIARTRCGASISESSDARLREGLAWVLAQKWVDRETRKILAEAARTLPG